MWRQLVYPDGRRALADVASYSTAVTGPTG